MSRLRESIYHCQNYRVPRWRRKTSDKVQSDVRPRARRNGKWSKKTAGGELLDLVWAQTGHEATKRRMSRSLVGHQNLWRMMASVPLTPGWTANLEADPTRRTPSERLRGTNKAPSGARGDLVTCERALFTVCSTPQTAAPTTQWCGRKPPWRTPLQLSRTDVRELRLTILWAGSVGDGNSNRPKNSASELVERSTS